MSVLAPLQSHCSCLARLPTGVWLTRTVLVPSGDGRGGPSAVAFYSQIYIYIVTCRCIASGGAVCVYGVYVTVLFCAIVSSLGGGTCAPVSRAAPN